MSQISKCPKVTVVLTYWEASGDVSELRYKSLLCFSSKRSYCIHVVFSIGKQYVCVSVPAEQRIRLDCLFVLTTIHLFWKVKVLFVTLTLAWMWFNTPLVYVICV